MDMNEPVIIRKRIKNAYIRVLPPDGRVSVSVPVDMTDEEIERLLQSRREWIRKHQERLKQNEGEVHLWGRRVDVSVSEGNGSTKGIRYDYSVDGDVISIRTSRKLEEQELEAVLHGIYRRETEAKLREYIPVAEARTGIHASSWHVKNMKSRWGSCKMSERKISISSRLAAYPEECLMHVIIHELCHIRVAGHGRDFYELMERYCPDWRRERKLLKENY